MGTSPGLMTQSKLTVQTPKMRSGVAFTEFAILLTFKDVADVSHCVPGQGT